MHIVPERTPQRPVAGFAQQTCTPAAIAHWVDPQETAPLGEVGAGGAALPPAPPPRPATIGAAAPAPACPAGDPPGLGAGGAGAAPPPAGTAAVSAEGGVGSPGVTGATVSAQPRKRCTSVTNSSSLASQPTTTRTNPPEYCGAELIEFASSTQPARSQQPSSSCSSERAAISPTVARREPACNRWPRISGTAPSRSRAAPPAARSGGPGDAPRDTRWW